MSKKSGISPVIVDALAGRDSPAFAKACAAAVALAHVVSKGDRYFPVYSPTRETETVRLHNASDGHGKIKRSYLFS